MFNFLVPVLAVVLVLGAVNAPAVPQTHMHVAVEADRIRIGDVEFVPRVATYLPRVLVVKPGETLVLPPDSTWDAIEVGGTLAVSRAQDTIVRFTHLTILPGGRLDAGTEADPVLRTVQFVVRDVPIDTARDPFQWGNGIINFGRQSRIGRRLTTWTELMEDVEAGATQLTLATAPEGWRVGDELLLPDMRQASARSPVRRETRVTIAAIAGNAVTLSKPLDFEHHSIATPDGDLVVKPRVANLSRNIVVRSENPAGVRGHTANVGHQATWDIRYNEFIGLGRTQNENLASAVVGDDGSVSAGTNQIGRYADHDHHAQGFGSRHIGNSYQSTGGSKWAVAVHGTHDVLLEQNVCTDFQGGCYVTEDGYEVRNVFRRNVAAYAAGNGSNAINNVSVQRGRDCPGCEGSGFWFRGVHQVIEGNEAWNNATGLNLFNTAHVGAGTLVPGTRGGGADTAFDPQRAVPIALRGNVTIGNDTGLEYWRMDRFPADDHLSAHNRSRQMWPSPGSQVYLRNPTLIGSGGESACIASSAAYTPTLEVDDGQIRGCEKGITNGAAGASVRLRGVVLQNRINVVLTFSMAETLLEDVVHQPLGAFPKQFIVLGGGAQPWQPGQPLPRYKSEEWMIQAGSPHAVVNWQGTGLDYRLVALGQNRSAPAWSVPGERHLVPEAGLTMGQAWDKYGMAYRGDVFQDGSIVFLDGLLNVLARPGLDRPLGLPRAVLTQPNTLSPAEVVTTRNGPGVVLYLLLTGRQDAANEDVVISIDGGEPVRLGRRSRVNERTYESAAVAPGIHEVRTWREDLSGARIPSSELRFHYFVEGPN